MKYEGVTFVDAEAKKLKRAEFIQTHLSVFWLDRDEPTRKRMLGNVHDLITNRKKK